VDVTPATKEQLAREKQKLAGAGVKDSLMRWHRSVSMMSGTFVILAGKPDLVSILHLDEWLSRVNDMKKDMERLHKKLAPKKRGKR
jgi:hypothetical protein